MVKLEPLLSSGAKVGDSLDFCFPGLDLISRYSYAYLPFHHDDVVFPSSNLFLIFNFCSGDVEALSFGSRIENYSYC